MDKLGDNGLVVDGRKLFFEYRYFFLIVFHILWISEFLFL